MTLRLDHEQLRRLAANDPVRAAVSLRHLRGRLTELQAGDFSNLPPNVNAEAWAAELTAGIDELEGTDR